MRNIKKHALAVAVTACILFSASSVFADGAALDVHTSTAADGTITAEVVLDGTLTVSGIQFALDYDDSRLQLSKYEYGDLKSSTVNDTESGKVALVWYSVNGIPVSGESSVLKLTFTPKADGEASISFNSNTLNTMVVDNNLATVATQTSGTTVSVSGVGITSNQSVGSVAPIATPSLIMPIPTPTNVIPTPRPPEKGVEATPTPSPKATAAAQIDTPPIPPATSDEQTTSPTAQPVSATPIIMENYQPPQLANTPDSNREPDVEPQIEVVSTASGKPTYLWLWVLGGIGLMTAGYLVYRRIVKK